MSHKMKDEITKRLTEKLSPVFLEVIDESSAHAGHEGMGAKPRESHFKVTIVSKSFDGVSLVKRHRMINDVLADLLKEKIHALTINASSSDSK